MTDVGAQWDARLARLAKRAQRPSCEHGGGARTSARSPASASAIRIVYMRRPRGARASYGRSAGSPTRDAEPDASDEQRGTATTEPGGVERGEHRGARTTSSPATRPSPRATTIERRAAAHATSCRRRDPRRRGRRRPRQHPRAEQCQHGTALPPSGVEHGAQRRRSRRAAAPRQRDRDRLVGPASTRRGDGANYQLACNHAAAGASRATRTQRHLGPSSRTSRAPASGPATDTDLDPLRDDPRFLRSSKTRTGAKTAPASAAGRRREATGRRRAARAQTAHKRTKRPRRRASAAAPAARPTA